jgi:uncharacterized membrane protein YccF (DUF307 family)
MCAYRGLAAFHRVLWLCFCVAWLALCLLWALDVAMHCVQIVPLPYSVCHVLLHSRVAIDIKKIGTPIII